MLYFNVLVTLSNRKLTSLNKKDIAFILLKRLTLTEDNIIELFFSNEQVLLGISGSKLARTTHGIQLLNKVKMR